MTATRARLDAHRWHLQHGPIDLIVGADGDAAAVQAAHDACWQRFAQILPELVAELPLLRRALSADASRNPCAGPVAARMWDACHPFRSRYITPMAAVAGSVADELIGAFARSGVTRAFINNGGDIALYLSAGAHYRIGLLADLATRDAGGAPGIAPLDAHCVVDAAMPVRGIATSGWRGRSFSLGIADSVTVLARDGARADAAATMIANAVDLPHPGIVRQPASSLKDDSDLGELRVTVDVPPLPAPLIERALASGVAEAQRLRDAGLIEGAVLFLQRHARALGCTAALPRVANEATGANEANEATGTVPAAAVGGARVVAHLHHPMEVPCSKYAAC